MYLEEHLLLKRIVKFVNAVRQFFKLWIGLNLAEEDGNLILYLIRQLNRSHGILGQIKFFISNCGLAVHLIH